jgi:hypothetical protein
LQAASQRCPALFCAVSLFLRCSYQWRFVQFGHPPIGNLSYTLAWDIAGSRAASHLLANAGAQTADSQRFSALASRLFTQYNATFGADLTQAQCPHVVLHPCRLYRADSAQAREAFDLVHALPWNSENYPALQSVHQGLVYGNRDSGYEILRVYLPHGADWLLDPRPGRRDQIVTILGALLRDSLIMEGDDDSVILFAGVDWLSKVISAKDFPTQHGRISFTWTPFCDLAVLDVTVTPTAGSVAPQSFILRLPHFWLPAQAVFADDPRVLADPVHRATNAEFTITPPANSRSWRLVIFDGPVSDGGQAQCVQRSAGSRSAPELCSSCVTVNTARCVDITVPAGTDLAASATVYCECRLGFAGLHCEVPSDPCLQQPCLNGGRCVAATGQPHYTCRCEQGTVVLCGLHCVLSFLQLR